jgi:hypothetical protein
LCYSSFPPGQCQERTVVRLWLLPSQFFPFSTHITIWCYTVSRTLNKRNILHTIKYFNMNGNFQENCTVYVKQIWWQDCPELSHQIYLNYYTWEKCNIFDLIVKIRENCGLSMKVNANIKIIQIKKYKCSYILNTNT